MAEIDLELAAAFDLNDSPIARPNCRDFVALDKAFEAEDYALDSTSRFTKGSDDDVSTIVMNLPRGRIARTSRREIQECRTPEQLRELDRRLYRGAGLDPRDFGL